MSSMVWGSSQFTFDTIIGVWQGLGTLLCATLNLHLECRSSSSWIFRGTSNHSPCQGAPTADRSLGITVLGSSGLILRPRLHSR